MPKMKKDGKYVNFYMSTQLVEALNSYSERTGISKTFCLEEALKSYLELNDNDFVQKKLEKTKENK